MQPDSHGWESQLRAVLGQAQALMASLALTPCGKHTAYIVAESDLSRFAEAMTKAIRESGK